MRSRFAALACCMVIMFSTAAVTATAAEAGTVHAAPVAASSCPGNFFSRLGLLLFQRSYASYIWLRYC